MAMVKTLARNLCGAYIGRVGMVAAAWMDTRDEGTSWVSTWDGRQDP